MRTATADELRPPNTAPFVIAQATPSAAPSGAGASSTIDPWAGVEEMVVSGGNQSSALLGAPTSVTSFDAIELEAQAIQTVGDLSAVTPNLEIRQNSATQATFFIRGVGLADFGANATSAVAVSQDGVGVNTAPLQLGQIFDTGSVDVLRGPRGSGAFRNGSAGAIVITSRKPEFEFQAGLRSRLGTWAPSVRGARQGLIQDYEGYLNVPMIEDVLAARVSFRLRQADPYKTNGCGTSLPFDLRVPRTATNRDPGPASQCGEKEPITFPAPNPFQGNDGLSPVPEGLPNLYGEEDNWAARGVLLFRPPDTDVEFMMNVHGSRLDQQPVVGQAMGTGFYPQGNSSTFLGGIINGTSSFSVNYIEPDQRRDFLARCNGQPPTGACANPNAGDDLARSLARNLDDRPYRGDYNREGRTRLETWGINFSATIPIIDSGFSTLELTFRSAYDRYDRYQERDLDYTPETIFEGQDEDNADQVWQELALNGEIDSMLIEWDVGAYFFWEDLDANLLLFLPKSPFVSFDPSITRVYDQESTAFGIWAGASWEFLEDFTLDAGVRYNWENKTFDLLRTQTNAQSSVGEDETWGAWTGSVSLEHRFTEDVSFTLKYSRGFKPGTFNAGVSAQAQKDTVDPETLDSFEGILSADFLGGRVGLRAELFYYLYKDYQIFLFSDRPTGPPVLEVRNASEVENYGADVDLTLRPLESLVDERYERLNINLRFGWLESQFIDFTNTRLIDSIIGPIPFVVDYSGNRLPNSPRFSVTGSFDWTFDLGRLGEITPRYDFTYTDDTFFDAEEGKGNSNIDGENTLPDYGTGQRAYILHNARLTWRPVGGNLELSAWIRNIRDTRYKLFAFDASQFSKLVINNVSPPRTIGADIKLTF